MSHKILEELLKSKGASLVGFCKLDASPIKNQPHLRYAISIAVKLSDSVLRTIDKRPSIMYFQHYRTVNYKLDQICLDCVKYLEDKGFDAFPIAGSQSKPTDKFSGVSTQNSRTSSRSWVHRQKFNVHYTRIWFKGKACHNINGYAT